MLTRWLLCAFWVQSLFVITRSKMISLHPSEPTFSIRGCTHQRAIDAQDKEHGAASAVTEELDGGPVILQAKVPVFEGDDADMLASQYSPKNTAFYPLVCKWFAEDRLSMANGQAIGQAKTWANTVTQSDSLKPNQIKKAAY
ncbi:formyltransferase family protein [Vibrio lentus]|nr:formyltransferase family protein [Vibrio lentus]